VYRGITIFSYSVNYGLKQFLSDLFFFIKNTVVDSRDVNRYADTLSKLKVRRIYLPYFVVEIFKKI